MSQLDDIYEQLQQLRRHMAEVLLLLSNVDASSSRNTFYDIAASVASWKAANAAFLKQYNQLKEQKVLAPVSTGSSESVPEGNAMESDFGYGFDLNMGMGQEFELGSDMLDEGIGGDLLTNGFLDLP